MLTPAKLFPKDNFGTSGVWSLPPLQISLPGEALGQGWRQKFSDRGAGASDGGGAKMTEKWCFHALFCQISSYENQKFTPMGG